MNARERILGNIRRRLDRTGGDTEAVDERLAGRPPGPLPERARGEPDALLERFVAMAQAASAEVERLADPGELPALVARLRAERGDRAPIAVAPAPALQALDWSAAGDDVEFRRAHADDGLGVADALCGVAETGTLVLASGPRSPVTLGFLPEVHVVALATASIVGGYEAAWERVRERGAMPRTVNWITGPSRSADIEQTLQLGAHGPVRLVIALHG